MMASMIYFIQDKFYNNFMFDCQVKFKKVLFI